MRQKKGLVLRDVCGEKVIIGEGLEAVDFGRLMCLNDKEFEVTKEQALQDVKDIVAKWEENGIIE